MTILTHTLPRRPKIVFGDAQAYNTAPVQAASAAGFRLFFLRIPRKKIEKKWRPIFRQSAIFANQFLAIQVCVFCMDMTHRRIF